ncbi:hypothetical protein ACHAW5_004342 [Stephanodiscus triporus]|uniref:Uncharacterized protein n=1 Tax=Stephanodiscus triporus TaxID=2934178 RepID=A0ABD3RBG2_9STRA
MYAKAKEDIQYHHLLWVSVAVFDDTLSFLDGVGSLEVTIHDTAMCNNGNFPSPSSRFGTIHNNTPFFR